MQSVSNNDNIVAAASTNNSRVDEVVCLPTQATTCSKFQARRLTKRVVDLQTTIHPNTGDDAHRSTSVDNYCLPLASPAYIRPATECALPSSHVLSSQANMNTSNNAASVYGQRVTHQQIPHSQPYDYVDHENFTTCVASAGIGPTIPAAVIPVGQASTSDVILLCRLQLQRRKPKNPIYLFQSLVYGAMLHEDVENHSMCPSRQNFNTTLQPFSKSIFVKRVFDLFKVPYVTPVGCLAEIFLLAFACDYFWCYDFQRYYSIYGFKKGMVGMIYICMNELLNCRSNK